MKLTNLFIAVFAGIVGVVWTLTTLANIADFMGVFQDLRELEARVSAVEMNCIWVGGEDIKC